jgi:hypothetical protein
MCLLPNRQKLEANDSGDQTVDSLSLGERWSMSNFSLKSTAEFKITNAAKKLRQSVLTQKLVLRFWWQSSDVTQKMCAILPQAAAQTHSARL